MLDFRNKLYISKFIVKIYGNIQGIYLYRFFPGFFSQRVIITFSISTVDTPKKCANDKLRQYSIHLLIFAFAFE